MRTTSTVIRRLITAPLALGLAIGLGACDDDRDTAPQATTSSTSDTIAESPDPTTPAPSSTPGDDVGATATAAADFCSEFIGLDMAFQAAPGDDPDAIGPYIDTEIMPRLETVRADVPAEVTDDVAVMLDAIETVATTGDFSVFESPEFADASATVYPYIGDACDLAVLDVQALDYSYEGVPGELGAGLAVVTMRNESASGEAHEMAFARVNDDIDLTLEELLALPMEELEQSVEIGGGVFAMAGDTGGMIVSLTPGRWVYVCLVPVGSVNGQQGTGAPHAIEGMSGELDVT